MADLVPPSDLVPSLPSRVVTIDVVGQTEGAAADGSVTFTLLGDIHVSADKKIVKAESLPVALTDGKGSIRLPVYDGATGDWAIAVKKSWAPYEYLVRVPAGETSIDLSQIIPLTAAPAGVANVLTAAGVQIVEGAQWGATVTNAGGVATFKFTVPPGAVAWDKGTLAAGDDLDLVVTPGVYVTAATPTSWTAQHYPTSARGTLQVSKLGTTGVFQTWITYQTASPRLFLRVKDAAWGAWREVAPSFVQVTAAQDLATLTVGTYGIASLPTDPVAQRYPGGESVRGWLEIRNITSTVLGWTFYEMAGAGRVWTTDNYGGFRTWRLIGPTPAPAPAAVASSSASLKRVGVPITAGHSGSDAALSGSARMPVLFGAPIIRWRLRIQDINPRSGVTRTGAIEVNGVWFAQHAGAGAAVAAPVQVLPAFSIPDGALEYRTRWVSTPIPVDVEGLISFGWSKATAPWAMLGHSYQTATQADAGLTNPAGLTKLGTAPFTISIEAETYDDTPVIASLGDSNSVGTGATNIVHDSWLSQLCRTLRALPQHLGSSGDTCAASQAAGYKYTRFSDLARADAVIMALGQNDAAATDSTSAAIIPLVNTVLGHLATYVSSSVYAVNYLPRTTNPWLGFEAVRRELTAHLNTQPGEIRDVFNAAAAISSDDETILAAYDSDGIHLNTAGFAQVAAVISRPIVNPRP